MSEGYLIAMIAISLPVLAVFGYGIKMFKYSPDELKPFFYFIFLSGIIEFGSKILWFLKLNNLPFLHLYVLLGFYFLSRFYQQMLDGFIDKWLINLMLYLFTAFTVINSTFIQPITTFNSFAVISESVFVVILSLLTFMVMLEDVVKKKKIKLARSMNWINSGLFIYYSSSLLIYYLNSFLFPDQSFRVFSREFHFQTWVLHGFFLLVMNFCFYLGLRFMPRQQ